MREVNKLKASDVSTLGDGKHADGQGLYRTTNHFSWYANGLESLWLRGFFVA